MRTDKELADRLLERAARGGAEMAEVFQTSSRLLSAEVDRGEVSAVENAVVFGYCLRLVRDRRLGFAYSTEPPEADAVADKALRMSEHTEVDESLDLPSPSVLPELDIYDPEVASVTEDGAISRALLIERASYAADDRIKRTRKVTASFSTGDSMLANSKGVFSEISSTRLGAHIMSVAEEGEESQMGWGYAAGRFLNEIDYALVGNEAAGRATRLLGARRISPIKAPVVLDNQVATEFLGVFASMLSAESVQKGKSMLAGRVGQKIMADAVSIVDDGLYPHGPSRRPVDAEGSPAGRTVLVGGGMLQGFMHNARTARKEGATNTANAVRGGFTSVPGVGPLCMFIDTDKEKLGLQAMFASMGEGLYIIETMGMHTANPISGEFSIGVSGIWVKGGKQAYPVREAVVSGNVLELFGRVQGIGEDLRFYGNTGSPSLLLGPTDISA